MRARYLSATLLFAVLSHAALLRIEIKERSDVPNTAYEQITGRAYFSVDPALPANRAVVDLDKAPRNADGPGGILERSLHAAAEIAGGLQRHGTLRSVQSRRQGHARHVQPRRPVSLRPRLHAGLARLAVRRAGAARPAATIRAHREGRHRRGARRDRGGPARAARIPWRTAIIARTRCCGPTIRRSPSRFATAWMARARPCRAANGTSRTGPRSR